MKIMLLIIMIMFSITIASNHFGFEKVNSIQQILQNEVTPINTFSLEECNDIDACNYNSTAENNDGCIYMAENECDCEGNIYDCSGFCGGDDFDSCLFMNVESVGFYDYEDCSGEFTSTIDGLCFTGDPNEFFASEISCINNNGNWIYFDICYTMDDYTEIFIETDIDNLDECMCGEGGIFDETYHSCIEGEEQSFTMWLSSDNLNGMFEFADHWRNLYFYNDGSFGEGNIDSDCMFLETPNQEGCESAGGYYDDDSECDWDGDTSEDNCISAGGNWNNGDCEVDNNDICTALGGEWEIDIDCDIPAIAHLCESAGGIYFGAGINIIGDYILNTNSITLNYYFEGIFHNVGEELGEIVSNNDGTELIIEFSDEEKCGEYHFTNDTPNAFSEMAISNIHIPDDFSFNAVSPNPFNPTTNVDFTLTKNTDVKITIFNILGESIQNIELGYLANGKHSFKWDAHELPSGVYLIQLSSNNSNGIMTSTQTKKALLIK